MATTARRVVLARSQAEAERLTQQLAPGVYEIVGTAGQNRSMTLAQVQANMRQHFARALRDRGLQLHVLDYNATTVRFELVKVAAASSEPGAVASLRLAEEPQLEAFALPLIVLSIAAAVALFFAWKLFTTVKEIAQVLLDPSNPVAVTYAAATGGVTLLAVGLGGFLLWRYLRGGA